MSLNLSAQNLEGFKWKNRLVILFGEKLPEALAHQKETLLNCNAGLKDRDILILEANDLIKAQLKIASDFQGLVLIGKDGGIKLQQSFTVPVKKLFVLIDGMPMRKSELRKKNKS